MFVQASYLPALVFPFTLVYNTDELAALETVLAVMMWWGHSWHATHPNPPVHIMDALDALLKYHDSKLHAHLKALKVSPGVLGWAMLNNLFTEVLSRTNWLKLMDLLVCHFEQISIILLAPIAIMKDLKAVLLSCDTSSQVALLLRSQQNVNMITVNRTILEWLRHTPPKYFSAVATRHLDGKYCCAHPWAFLAFYLVVGETHDQLQCGQSRRFYRTVSQFMHLRIRYCYYSQACGWSWVRAGLPRSCS
jgi:hypothetical protein